MHSMFHGSSSFLLSEGEMSRRRSSHPSCTSVSAVGVCWGDPGGLKGWAPVIVFGRGSPLGLWAQQDQRWVRREVGRWGCVRTQFALT